MWEQTRLYLRFNTLGRRLLTFVAAIFATLLVYGLFLSITACAEPATCQYNSSIVYEDREFVRNTGESTTSRLGLNSGAVVFSRLNDSRTQIEYIYFPNLSASSTSSTAQLVRYDWAPPGELSNKDGPTEISITPRTNDPNEVIENTSSCVDAQGIGWIVCPVTRWLASGTDWLFNVLSEFLAVPPLLSDTDAPLYRIWKMMLGLANLAFILAFIVIIYSQLTSIGLSNYGIKRLLPRLIIAAILVNISYYVCAVAVDLSNILGFELQNMFIDMRNSVVGESGNGWQIVTWEDVATAVLAGSATVATAGTAAFVSLAASGGGSLILLLPTLLGVLL